MLIIKDTPRVLALQRLSISLSLRSQWRVIFISYSYTMIAFSLWSVHIYRYGIMYMLSFVIGYSTLMIGQQRWWYKQYPLIDNLLKNNLDELILAIMIGVMIGWRMGHVLIYDLAYFIAHPLKIFAIQQWWMSFIGGIVGTILSVTSYLTLNSTKPHPNPSPKMEEGLSSMCTYILSLLDSFIPLVPVGIFFGRFGNFLNQELYGTIVPTDFRWWSQWLVQFAFDTQLFHVYDKIWSELRINTNFLSMIFEWLILAIVLRICFFRRRVSKKWSAWQLSAVFLWWYSAVRFLLEYLRQDSQAEFVWWFTKSQWFFVVFMLIAVIVFFIKNTKQKRWFSKIQLD